ncbi:MULTISPECIES: hypothetical protein [Rhodomicrobium]|uniref:hypothetical protein n=1 Tax=Rhodomicrobium TaxID=1068 RepID=UPI000B4BC5A2|nr:MULTISPECIES: hypothetical protein [Rhodomicrobium]
MIEPFSYTILLPHTVAFNAAVPELLQPLSVQFGGLPGRGLYNFAASVGAQAPLALESLGLSARTMSAGASKRAGGQGV